MRKSDTTIKVERERLADATLLALKMEDGTMIQGICRQALEMEKGKDTDCPLEFPEELQCCQPILEF